MRIWEWIRSDAGRDHLERQLAEERERSDLRVANAEARHDALLEKYHELRAAGHDAGPKPLPAKQKPDSPSDLAIEDVVSRFGGNPRLRRILLTYQRKQRLAGQDEDGIADRIRNWTDPDADLVAWSGGVG